jgi:hypothetical protein
MGNHMKKQHCENGEHPIRGQSRGKLRSTLLHHRSRNDYPAREYTQASGSAVPLDIG